MNIIYFNDVQPDRRRNKKFRKCCLPFLKDLKKNRSEFLKKALMDFFFNFNVYLISITPTLTLSSNYYGFYYEEMYFDFLLVNGLGLETEWRKLEDLARDTGTVLQGLEVILHVTRPWRSFRGDQSGSASLPHSAQFVSSLFLSSLLSNALIHHA